MPSLSLAIAVVTSHTCYEAKKGSANQDHVTQKAQTLKTSVGVVEAEDGGLDLSSLDCERLWFRGEEPK